jgi:branched-chain amino acid transport system ATP-binding protein
MALLELKNVNSGYNKRQVLFDVSFEVAAGNITLLIGANGSGKSTVLKTIYGLLDPGPAHYRKAQSGVDEKITFDGNDILHSSPSKLLSLGLMYVPQRDYCFDNLTVQENMQISRRALKDRSLFKGRYDQVLELLPTLKTIPNCLAMKLSGGERQVLALGMALVHRPKLLMLDEPLAGLSPKSINEVSGVLKNLNQTHGVTFLIVEQNLADGLKIASGLIGLRLGQVVNSFDPTSGFESCMLKDIFL